MRIESEVGVGEENVVEEVEDVGEERAVRGKIVVKEGVVEEENFMDE
jgi:hypothetical protein